MKETVEQYLARGGKITHIPAGHSGEKRLQLKATGKAPIYTNDAKPNDWRQGSYKRALAANPGLGDQSSPDK